MSYILDALKKSENERRAGATPGLAPAASYVVLPTTRSHHRGAALLVAAGMLGTGLALGNWRPWQADLAGVNAPLAAPVAAAVPTPAAVATAVESPPPVKSRPGGAAKTPPAVTPKTSTVADKKKSFPPPKDPPVVVAIAQPAASSAAVGGAPDVVANPPALSSPNAAARATMTAPPAVAVPAAARVALPLPAAVPVAVAAPAAVGAPVTAAPTVAAVATVAVAAPAPAPASRVVALRELPPAVQSALPNIVFGGFAGGGEADGRIAFINNRLVREGEEVSPGLRLETVDQDGAVLGFQGHHFRTTR